MKFFKLALALSMLSSALTVGCGSPKKSRKKTTEKRQAESNEPKQSERQTRLIRRTYQRINYKTVNGQPVDTFAIFVAKPYVKGQTIQAVTINGNPLSNSLKGFEAAKISKGVINAESMKEMKSLLKALKPEEITFLSDHFQDCVFVYVENQSYNFQEPGTKQEIKVTLDEANKQDVIFRVNTTMPPQ